VLCNRFVIHALDIDMVVGGCWVTDRVGPWRTVRCYSAFQGLATPWTVLYPAELSAPWDCGLVIRCLFRLGSDS